MAGSAVCSWSSSYGPQPDRDGPRVQRPRPATSWQLMRDIGLLVHEPKKNRELLSSRLNALQMFFLFGDSWGLGENSSPWGCPLPLIGWPSVAPRPFRGRPCRGPHLGAGFLSLGERLPAGVPRPGKAKSKASNSGRARSRPMETFHLEHSI